MRHWIDIVSDNRLFEMAFERREMRSAIAALAIPLSEHVIKIIVMPHSIDRLHWEKEAVGWLMQIDMKTLKPKRKKFRDSEYLDLLFNENFEDDLININYVISAMSKEDYQIEPYDSQNVYDRMAKFYKDISKVLAARAMPENIEKFTYSLKTL